MDLKPTLFVFLGALSSIPLVYFLNTTSAMGDQRWIFVAGVITLSCVAMVYYYIISMTSKQMGKRKQDPLMYIWCVFSFTCCVDFLIGAELDGYISGFMTFYLNFGEPYLVTAHGSLINWWDGTGQFLMCLILFTLHWNKQEYRHTGLYWVGSIGNSMFALLLGGATGTFKVKWSYFLNVPYVVGPIYAAVRFLNEGREQRRKTQEDFDKKPLKERPGDVFFIIYFILGTCVALFRGIAALGCDSEYIASYLTNVEPYLKDPNQFSRIQVLVYLFYFVPFYLMTIAGLMCPQGQGWIRDWAFIHAGASTQSQLVHMLASTHHRTLPQYRTLTSGNGAVAFWVINMALFVVPQLFALRCRSETSGNPLKCIINMFSGVKCSDSSFSSSSSPSKGRASPVKNSPVKTTPKKSQPLPVASSHRMQTRSRKAS